MNITYEFLTYEVFPEDQYTREVVEVCINGTLVLPYQHLKMKDGGSFWSFPGCSASKDGSKKRFNSVFDSRSAKIKFENDLELFIKGKLYPQGKPSVQAQQPSQTSGEPDWGNPPF